VEFTGNPDIEIKQIEYDSRLVGKDCLFVAVKGFKSDGYDFVEEARKRGAVAVIGERKKCEAIENHVRVKNVRQAMADIAAKFYDYPGMGIKTYGVTGTNGKTTVSFLLKNILKAKGKSSGMVTSIVYDTGREEFVAERTTPEALDLQRLLYLMKNNECENAIIEVSSHALMLHRVDNIKFQVAVYTNLSRDHLDFHKTMKEYLKAKARLLDKLDHSLGQAVINLDVPEFRELLRESPVPCLRYSLSDKTADVYCRNYELHPHDTMFDLVTPMGSRSIYLKLPGWFNLNNAVAAAAGGLAGGIDLDSVVRGLDEAQTVPGRFNYITCGQPFAVYVDYAHTPDAIERLCQSARELTKGRLLILFGCGGDRDRGKRPLMGKAATTGADYAIVTSDNPRSEKPETIIKDIKPGLKGQNYEIVTDRQQAIAMILKKAGEHDAVLIAGKGAENYQEINGVRYPFSDSEEIIKVLTELGYRPAKNEVEN